MSFEANGLQHMALSALVLGLAMGDVVAQARQYQDALRISPAVAQPARVSLRANRELTVDDAGVDARLGDFAVANSANAAVQPALVQAAMAVTQAPARYLNADGSANLGAMRELLDDQFAQAGRIAVPKLAADYDAGNAGRVAAATPADMSEADIEQLVFIVMAEAARSARADLRDIMDGVRSINQQKRALREAANRLDELAADCIVGPEDCYVSDRDADVLAFVAQGRVDKRALDAAKEAVKDKLDSLGEMGEMESMRLQMAMDRRSKMMETLSNLLKKMNETASGIIGNMK